VLRGKLAQAAVEFWQWLTDNRIEIGPFDAVQAHEATAAFDRYGKGLHLRARLNLADCAAYALRLALRPGNAGSLRAAPARSLAGKLQPRY
jgi:uncharacterized protein with PIN domain